MIDLEPWHDLFVMTGGAAAALAGLLFVAVSLNLDQVLQYRALPAVAAQSVAMLVALVVLSLLALAPGNTPWFGVEVLGLAAVLALLVFVPLVRALSALDRPSWRIQRLLQAALPTLPFLVAGILLVAGSPAAMAWVLIAVVAVFVIATLNAWVLLIEIRR